MKRKKKGKLKRQVLSCLTAAIIAFVSVFATPVTIAAEDTAVSSQCSEDELCKQSFELYPNGEESEEVVTLDGIMPENANVTVEDVSGERDAVAAYDITITDEDNNEFQPLEKAPIFVEISDPEIDGSSETLELWHVKDDGEREQITDFTLEDGKISFFASGFSVYEIVDPLPEVSSNVLDILAERGEEGFFVSFENGENNTSWYFDGTVTTIPNQGNRTGIKVFSKTDSTEGAIKLYFENVGGSNTDYYIYTLDENEQRKYFRMFEGNFGGKPDRSALGYEDNDNPKSLFKVKYINNKKRFKIYYTGGSRDFYWVYDYRKVNQVEYNTVVGYKAENDVNVCNINIEGLIDNNLELDGKSFGLMNYTAGTLGSALMESPASLYTKVFQIETKDTNQKPHTYYVSDNVDLTAWTFVLKSGDDYYLRSNGGNYLKVNNNSLTTTANQNEASAFTVNANDDGSIKLVNGTKTVICNNDTFSLSSSPTAEQAKLYFVSETQVTADDKLTVTANMISVSSSFSQYQEENKDIEVIVYTRLWDDTNKKYNYYAIDHDGSLKQVYSYGDKIMWLDDAINTLLWKFTIYTNSDGSENGYYELQNTFSDKYLAPQLTSGQILSDRKIGIVMPGRSYSKVGDDEYFGEYYSTILAWDNGYYEYVGVEANSTTEMIQPSAMAKADTFYFATFDSLLVSEQSSRLHEVETVDNDEYGITLKMKDFDSRAQMYGFLGNDEGGTNNYPIAGLLSNQLAANGYPTITKKNNNSMSEMYAGANECNHLFIKSIHDSTGYFEFDSCQTFATLQDKNGQLTDNFTVYRELGTYKDVSKNSLRHGQFLPYDTIQPNVYAVDNKNTDNDKIARNECQASTEPIDDDDPRKGEYLHKVISSNSVGADYQFGMELDAKFVQTPSGLDAWGHDIIFEFTGDDDFWLYVDDELVLDLGGIHSAIGGKVNFRTGKVTTTVKSGTGGALVTRELRDVFKANAIARGKTAEEAEEWVSSLFEDNHEKTEANRGYVFKDYTVHSMKIFYMERGAGASNLHMRFNLSAVTPGNVLFAKELTENGEDVDFGSMKFPFQIEYSFEEEPSTDDDWNLLDYRDSTQHVNVSYQNSTQSVDFASTYTPPSGGTPYRNVFFLFPGRPLEIHFPDNTNFYRITECAVNTNVYDVEANNGDVTFEHNVISGSIEDLKTQEQEVQVQPSIAFNNKINPDKIHSLNIKKVLYDEEYDENYTPLLPGDPTLEEYKAQHELRYSPGSNDSDVDNTVFSYRLYLWDDQKGNYALTDMRPYYVIDENKYLCEWDPIAMRFKRYEVTDSVSGTTTSFQTVTELTDAQKERITFKTSRYGAISNIPAGYTVIVPNLVVGTKFMVEERDYEIPIGYGLIGFECQTGELEGQQFQASYLIQNKPGYPENSIGEIKDAGYDAYMNVQNRRGIGLEADKVWSDKDFTKSHSDIFTAVYLGNSADPMEDTVKQIKSPETTVKYFFEKLEEGKTLADYHIYEVTLTGAAFDAEGYLTGYTGVTKLNEADILRNITVTDLSDDESTQEYDVSYTVGTPRRTGAAGSNNVRIDTITNTRKGGVEIYLYEWNNDNDGADTPLAGGKFKIFKYDSTEEDYSELIGEYTSDSKGKVTVMYGLNGGEKFKLVQTYSPKAYDSDINKSYVGISDPIYFEVIETAGSEGEYTITNWSNENDRELDGNNDPLYDENDSIRSDGKCWAEYTTPTNNGMAAKIDIYNKPFTLQVKKVQGGSGTPLPGVKFALHKDVEVLGKLQESFDALPGYTELTTDSNGVIPKIDQTLVPLEGKSYYLRETQPLDGYEGLEEDIKFNVTDIGVITCENEQYLDKLETVDGNTIHITYTISVPNTAALDYYFDIEKIAFVDKNVHDSDETQKFVFRVDRFSETETDFSKNNNILDSFYVSVNCDGTITYTDDDHITLGGSAYNYQLYHAPDNAGGTKSQFIAGGGDVKIKKTYDTDKVYTYPAAIRHGVQTVHVQQSGIYRVTELTCWSNTDYDFWNGSNILKGAAAKAEGAECTMPEGYPSVIFSVKDINADRFSQPSYTDSTTHETTYRPTASFTNSETEYAYLSAQAYAENEIACKPKSNQGGG